MLAKRLDYNKKEQQKKEQESKRNLDQELLRLFRIERKEDEVMRQIYLSPARGEIERFVLFHHGTKDDAIDFFHDALMILLDKMRSTDFVLTSSIKTYLFAIVKNKWYGKLKKDKVHIKKRFLINEEDKQIINQLHLRFTSIDIFDPNNNRFSDEGTFKLEQEEQERVLKTFITELLKHPEIKNDCPDLLKKVFYQNFSIAKIKEAFSLKNNQTAKNKKSRCLNKLRAFARQTPLFKTFFNS